MTSTTLLGVAIDGAGAHPAAWTVPGVADTLLDPARLVDLALLAERSGLDFISLNDSFDPSAPGEPQVPVRLDALLSLARVAPVTSSIGLLATASTTHTEPFHLSKNLATLDLVSGGRAAWRVGVATTDSAARRFGRTHAQQPELLWREADDAIEVVTRLWDSWEDDAVIRDASTGRYVDRDKLHYIDFSGEFFSVRGPSITPRPPQGQPVIAVDLDAFSVRTASAHANLGIVATPHADVAAAARRLFRRLAEEHGRTPEDLHVLARVRIGEPALRRELDRHGSNASSPHTLDIVGDAAAIASTFSEWIETGTVDGFLLELDVLPNSLSWLADEVLPELRRRGIALPRHGQPTFRDRLGLSRPHNRYSTIEVSA
jgi:alkanesulfonate monooxygenase SsuD/methylene tetrahydromethanopterin reductase-like flavin-dependent oxidoreductase (luciferase family)